MKKSLAEVNTRRDQLFSELVSNPSIKVSDLAIKLKVSELTIRRDLLFLEQKNMIERFYGGARLVSPSKQTDADQRLSRIKHAMARRAAEMVDSGDTIFVNTSSTALLTLGYLKDKEVTVITNNGRALFNNYPSNITIILSGGELHPPKNTLTGDFAIQTLSQVHVSKAILGCSGFSIENGMTTSMHHEMQINKIMLSNCRGKRILLADHSKLGHNANYSSGSAHEIDMLITNDADNHDYAHRIQFETNIEVQTVSSNELSMK